MVSGMPIEVPALAIAATASLSEYPGARSKLSVTEGNCSWCDSSSGAVVFSKRAMDASGTWVLLAPGTRSRPSMAGFSCQAGLASSTTRYWFACPKMVEICRCPNESYSVSWIACIDTPRRIAASRSTLTKVRKPFSCWSDATLRSTGTVASLASNFGAQADSSTASVSISVYWNWVRLIRAPI